jgi:hypothetical protein
MSSCGQYDHHYFVADVVLVPSEGKIVLLALCTACGDFKSYDKQVAAPHTALDSLKRQNKS